MLSSYLLPTTSNPKLPPKTNIQADVVVIGAGPAGRKAATRIAAAGKKCIIVDAVEFPGGSNLVAGAVASKAMWKYIENNFPQVERHNAKPLSYQQGQEVFNNIKTSIQSVIKAEGNENLAKVTLSTQLLDGVNISKPVFVQGWANFTESLQIAVHNKDSVQVIDADKIVIATGSSPRQIDSLPWVKDKIVSSDDILLIPTLPKSIVIVGAGIVGIEYASYFRSLGAEVTLINRSDGILTGTEDIINQGVKNSLEQIGVDIVSSNGVKQSSINKDGVINLTLNDNSLITCDVVLVAAGRVPNITNLIDSSNSELESYLKSRSLTPKVFDKDGVSVEVAMIGDVGSDGGVVPKALNQGYRLGEYFAGLKTLDPNDASEETVPTAIFSLPPAAYVGLTEDAAKQQGYEVVCGTAHIEENAMSMIGDTAAGELKLVFNERNGALLGAHIFGPEAHELINIAIGYLNLEGALNKLQNCSFSYPSLAGLYRQAAQTINANSNNQAIAVQHVSSDLIRVPNRRLLAEQINSFPTDTRSIQSVKIEPSQVLAVYKSSLYERLKTHPNYTNNNKADQEKIYQSHLEQQNALNEFKQVFPEAKLVSRDEFRKLIQEGKLDDYKAVLALGGDNHSQWVSHWLGSDHIFIGVNSDPQYSAGNTLQFTWHDLSGVRQHLINGSYKVKPVTRLEAHLNGTKLPSALSEIFIGRQASINTATIAESLLDDETGFSELVRSKSSGYLVASPMGSTGWTGKVLEEQFHFNPAIDSSKLGAIIVRREHFSGANNKVSAKTLTGPEVLKLVSEMNDGGVISVDCDWDTQFEFNRGSELIISLDAKPLWWFGI
jgi:pyruvate/2-oxoglutarate dehydrogenase complex dihydrolipoamide dehydrogenase (E3) component/NAD kinase